MKNVISFGLVTLLATGASLMLPSMALAQPLPEPSTTIALPQKSITIQITNQAGSAVEYQVITDTDVRSLPDGTEVTLSGLSAPITLIFQYDSLSVDGSGPASLLTAELTQNPQTGVLEVVFTPATDSSVSSSSLEIDNQGNVFIF